MDFLKGNDLTCILLIIILMLTILILMLCKNRSTFGAGSTTVKTSVNPAISDDSVLIFYAPWCGYCKNSMRDFKNAVARGQGKVILIDATEDSNKDLAEQYGVQGFPTIIKGNREPFNGPDRSEESIIEFLKEK
jgi:thiol-disulfide isomerase/thioredoxin